MVKNVSQLIKEATEAVKDVPDDLRPVAFQKAFDALAGEQGGGGVTSTSPTVKGRRSTGGGSKKQTHQTSGDSNRSQLDQLDRTSYPKITQDATALANSLRVLQAAHDELGIDGLSATDIAHVLTEKFRYRITRPSVSRALNGAGLFVNRHKEGNSVIFKIMSGGEKYLSDLDSGTASEPAKPTKKKSKSAKKAKATKKTASSTSSSDGTSTKKTTKKTKAKAKSAKNSSSRPGPKAALQKLIDGGYFAKPRGISDIIEHLRHSVGYAYKHTELSLTLLRLLREETLTRTRNSENQYEYKDA